MNAKMLFPVLIALHLAAAALIIDGLGVEGQESSDPSGAWQHVQWNPDPVCLAGHANDDLARNWSSENRQWGAMGSDQRSCVNTR